MNPERHACTSQKSVPYFAPAVFSTVFHAAFGRITRLQYDPLCAEENQSQSGLFGEDLEPLAWVQRPTFTKPIMTSCWASVCSWLEAIGHLCGWLICVTSGKRKASATRRSPLGPKVKTEERSWRRRGGREWACVWVFVWSGNQREII